MTRKHIFGIACAIIASISTFSVLAYGEANVVVTNNGLAFLKGTTKIESGAPVVIQILQKGEGFIDGSNNINGYVNETIIQPDGTYRLLFSLNDKYIIGNEYECHIDIAGKEYNVVPLVEGSLIEITKKSFDRDLKTVNIEGSLWDNSVFGCNLTLTMGSFKKTVKSSTDGKFSFGFSMTEAGVDYGKYDFVIAYTDDSSNFVEDSIEMVSADAVLTKIKNNLYNSSELKKIITDETNLNILGFDKSVIFDDGEIYDILSDEYFEKLVKCKAETNSVANLKKSIQTAYVLYNMEISPSDANMRRLINLIGLDETDEITALYYGITNPPEIKYLFDLWKKANLTNLSDASKFYREAVLLTKLNNAEAWSNLMQLVNSNQSIFDLSGQTSAAFWQKLIAKSPFSSIDDFKSQYKNLLNDKKEKSSAGSGGGGGGSGVGYSVGSGETSTEKTEKTDETNKGNFTDVPEGHWAFDAVNSLFEKGIIKGKSENIFAPNDLVTRAETAKLMCLSANLPLIEGDEDDFSDVEKKHWAYNYIETVYSNDLVKGLGAGKFGPNETTTREEMAIFCFRLLKYIKPEAISEEFTRDDLSFEDSNAIADYAINAVTNMVKLGVINGKGDNKFEPKAFCTRAETAKMIFGVLSHGQE